ncbi:hypothetical protein HDK90DRAFT_462464 [Phyllosticta capitalensis]|uniref:Uncharacterized protein n=1 Tax=Phyllosticta capitalensis TaxID=121624 RepID=A0ABR1YYG5_9PEZI
MIRSRTHVKEIVALVALLLVLILLWYRILYDVHGRRNDGVASTELYQQLESVQEEQQLATEPESWSTESTSAITALEDIMDMEATSTTETTAQSTAEDNTTAAIETESATDWEAIVAGLSTSAFPESTATASSEASSMTSSAEEFPISSSEELISSSEVDSSSTAETSTSSSEEPTSSSTEVSSSTVISMPKSVSIPGSQFAIVSELSFGPGAVKPPGYNYTKAVVIPRTSKEDISWLENTFGDDNLLQKAVYTVDKPVKPYVLPSNKGNEVMAYLTFIIDFYDHLPDVSIFMHAHEYAWHNNELLEMSSSAMLTHLNLRKVVRDGYVNLRCHRYPSCPDHLFPYAKNHSVWDVPEEAIFADAWSEILPHEPVPEVLSQPCCAQFAVSRERIRALPRSQYKHFRKWLMYTTLENRVSGRVWEYIYQYIWAGVPQFCPEEHSCYCELYGLCFGGEKEYNYFFQKKAVVTSLADMARQQAASEEGNATYPIDYVAHLQTATQEVKDELDMAFLRGMSPYYRALEAGREWVEGDGF